MILVEVEMWCMFHNLDSCFPIWNHILFDNISVTLLQIHKEKENYRELNGLQSAPLQMLYIILPGLKKT